MVDARGALGRARLQANDDNERAHLEMERLQRRQVAEAEQFEFAQAQLRFAKSRLDCAKTWCYEQRGALAAVRCHVDGLNTRTRAECAPRVLTISGMSESLAVLKAETTDLAHQLSTAQLQLEESRAQLRDNEARIEKLREDVVLAAEDAGRAEHEFDLIRADLNERTAAAAVTVREERLVHGSELRRELAAARGAIRKITTESQGRPASARSGSVPKRARSQASEAPRKPAPKQSLARQGQQAQAQQVGALRSWQSEAAASSRKMSEAIEESQRGCQREIRRAQELEETMGRMGRAASRGHEATQSPDRRFSRSTSPCGWRQSREAPLPGREALPSSRHPGPLREPVAAAPDRAEWWPSRTCSPRVTEPEPLTAYDIMGPFEEDPAELEFLNEIERLSAASTPRQRPRIRRDRPLTSQPLRAERARCARPKSASRATSPARHSAPWRGPGALARSVMAVPLMA